MYHISHVLSKYAKLFITIFAVITLSGCNADSNKITPTTSKTENETESKSESIKSINAVDAIIDAYKEHQVVAIGDVHGLVEEREFIISLINTPQFYENVKTIVIETGNAKYQDVADDYVNGENIDINELQKIWRDLTSSGIGPTDKMSNQDLFDSVREINAKLPDDERLRIILGDPAIDWSEIETREDFSPWLMKRDEVYTEAVLENVYKNDMKGLLICGASHFSRSTNSTVGADNQKPKKTILDSIEELYPDSVYLVQIHMGFGKDNEHLEEKLEEISTPSILLIENTWIGELPSSSSSLNSDVKGNAGYGNASIGSGNTEKGENEKMQKKVMPTEVQTKEEVMDAYLYLGRASSLTINNPPTEIYSDNEYYNELNRRHTIVQGKSLNRESLLEEKPSSFLENY